MKKNFNDFELENILGGDKPEKGTLVISTNESEGDTVQVDDEAVPE